MIDPEIEDLFYAAKESSPDHREQLLRKAAMLLVTSDDKRIEHHANIAESTGVETRDGFINLVHSYQNTPPRSESRNTPSSDKKMTKPTDDELADKWLEEHPDTCFGMGEFYRYENGLWKPLEDAKVENEILGVLRDSKINGVRPNNRLLRSVRDLVRVQINVPADKWDASPDHLPLKNGVLHIPTLNMLPHSKDYFFTSGLDFSYDAGAKCPVFNRVLDETVPEAKEFIQEFAGYSLTTDTQYELALWLYGPSGSGKSTVLLGLQTMLGSRAGLLGLADIERSRFALTNVPGKTLLTSTEQPSMYFTATHTLNALISGEPIEIDRKFLPPFQLSPRAKVAWAMNDLPRIKDPGNGLYRRIRLVRFPPIDENRRNPRIKKAIKNEGPGILNWALDGLARLRKRGRFEIPSSVQSATNDFQQSNDVPALFVEERCLIGLEYKTQAQLLYDAYNDWCFSNGHKAQSSTSIAEDWKRLGFTKMESGGRNFWKGVGLKAM